MKRLRIPRDHVVSLVIAVMTVAIISVGAHLLSRPTPENVSVPRPTPSMAPQLHDTTDVVAPKK